MEPYRSTRALLDPDDALTTRYVLVEVRHHWRLLRLTLIFFSSDLARYTILLLWVSERREWVQSPRRQARSRGILYLMIWIPFDLLSRRMRASWRLHPSTPHITRTLDSWHHSATLIQPSRSRAQPYLHDQSFSACLRKSTIVSCKNWESSTKLHHHLAARHAISETWARLLWLAGRGIKLWEWDCKWLGFSYLLLPWAYAFLLQLWTDLHRGNRSKGPHEETQIEVWCAAEALEANPTGTKSAGSICAWAQSP